MIKSGLQYEFDDPAVFVRFFWPHIRLTNAQLEIMRSVRDNDETTVPAANMMGKDFIAALIALWFFCSRGPARVMTTSVDGSQLEGVLWGEIRRHIKEAVHPLPILYNHLHIRKVLPDGSLCPLSEIIGRVAKVGEGMLGRHIASPDGRPRTLAIFDEASSIDEDNYNATDTWAHRKLIIGNPYPCNNFFRRHVREGNLADPDQPGRYYRRVIQIKATDSPNVIMGLLAKAHGLPIPENIIPGVMGYREYAKRLATWDPMRLSIGIHAEFWEGANVLLYPPDWLNASATLATTLSGQKRGPFTMGIDGAEGGDKTSWAIVDELGLYHMEAFQTPDTGVIGPNTLRLMHQHGIDPHDVYFDLGGGGAAQAGFLRRQLGKRNAFPTVHFGESATDPDRFKRMRNSREKRQDTEKRIKFKNRRAEMYGLIRELLDPAISDRGFAIPAEYKDLRAQLGPIPFMLDPEGRLVLPPKRKKDKDSDEVSLTEICGGSPDEADSLALAVYGLYNHRSKIKVGAF